MRILWVILIGAGFFFLMKKMHGAGGCCGGGHSHGEKTESNDEHRHESNKDL